MRRIILASYAFAATVAIVVACSKRAPPEEADSGELRAGAVGSKLVDTAAPALTVTTVDGNQLDLATLYGEKPVYIKFWATWCKPCREQMAKFEKLYETLGDRIHFVAVNVGLDDSPDAVRAFRDEHGLRMPIIIDDGRLADALDLQITPQHVLVDRSARIAFVGHRDGAALERALELALVKPAVSRTAPRALAADRPLRVGDRIDPAVLSLLGNAHQPRAVVLFATWCESYLAERQPIAAANCKRVRERVDALRESRPGVAWIGVATRLWSEPADVPAYVAETKTRLPITFDRDGALFRAFDVRMFGTVVLLDADGQVTRIVAPTDDLTVATL